jgi:glycosyltransferase involved in cell wall biosynthesis
MKYDITLVVPLFNEKENILELYEKSCSVLRGMEIDYEMIFIEDGSEDGSFELLLRLAEKDPRLKLIKFKKKFGQTAAIQAGITNASKPVIVTMDGDLQNDPQDIPRLIEKLGEGVDVVNGWRKERKDPFLSRRLPSIIANKIISWFCGVPLNDYGCTLKALRASCIQSIPLYGEMHRFIPALIAREGGHILELEVKHYPRLKGYSKYGINRTFKVVLDLFLLKFLSGYSTRPIHFFGIFGLINIFLGGICGIFTTYQRYVVGLHGVDMVPLILLTMLLFLMGMQMVLIGLLAEINVRSYYESLTKLTYSIDKQINFT